ncbi:ArnT family glycosyltransferase [Sphingomonas sp. 22176]|uniref:ArnT family glycosyltransferase n=1 Tax=Sphingomonas sp. 22176 TaxID=3453884 RepID=UPI003F855C15
MTAIGVVFVTAPENSARRARASHSEHDRRERTPARQGQTRRRHGEEYAGDIYSTCSRQGPDMTARIETHGAAVARKDWRSMTAALPRWLVLLVAAALVRSPTFGNPLVHVDEEFYFVTAQHMLHGALPFVDIFDRKPVGLFLLYVPAAALGFPWGILAYQLMALASVVLTAVMIARLADRAGWHRGATPAALLYIFMLNIADGQGGQAPIFYNLMMIGAIALVLPRADDAAADWRRIARAMGAMLLVGLAMQVKYSVLFEGLFLGLWLTVREWRLGATPLQWAIRIAAYALAAMVPTVLAGAVYAALGHFDAWFFANFKSILDRKSDPASELALAFLQMVLFLGPLLTVCWFSRRLPPADALTEQRRNLLFGWLIASVVGLILFGSWFNHYALPVMMPASLCCAGFFGAAPQGRRIVAPALLAVALVAGETIVVTSAWRRGNDAQLETIAAAIGHGPGCLYLHSGDTAIYAASGRCAASAWVFPSHLARERENGAVGVDQLEEVDRIFRRHPAVVAMRTPFSGERRVVRERVLQYLQRDGYRLRGRYPIGDDYISVYGAAVDDRSAERYVASGASY